MKKIIALLILAASLTACGSSLDVEDVDGTKCVVARRNLNDRVTAISCDWPDR